MRAASQKRFFHVPLLILISVIATASLLAIPSRHLLEGSAHGGGHNHPGIRFVIGANKSGQTGTIDTPGTVKVLCNQ